jgi:hypothetical protein
MRRQFAERLKPLAGFRFLQQPGQIALFERITVPVGSLMYVFDQPYAACLARPSAHTICLIHVPTSVPADAAAPNPGALDTHEHWKAMEQKGGAEWECGRGFSRPCSVPPDHR